MTTFSAPGSDFVRDASILSDDEVMMDARQARDLSPCSVIDPADPRYGKCEQVCLHGGLCSRRMATGSTMCTQHTKLVCHLLYTYILQHTPNIVYSIVPTSSLLLLFACLLVHPPDPGLLPALALAPVRLQLRSPLLLLANQLQCCLAR